MIRQIPRILFFKKWLISQSQMVYPGPYKQSGIISIQHTFRSLLNLRYNLQDILRGISNLWIITYAFFSTHTSFWKGVGRGFIWQEPIAISERKRECGFIPALQLRNHRFTRSCGRHPCTSEQFRSCLFTDDPFFPSFLFFGHFHRVDYSFLITALRPTASQAKQVRYKTNCKTSCC